MVTTHYGSTLTHLFLVDVTILQFANDSKRIVEAVRRGRVQAIVTALVHTELKGAPEPVRNVMAALPEDNVTTIELTDDVIDLHEAYLAAGILGPRSANDALHVAAATVARADAIVSWNFRHIVRLDKMKSYNRVNFMMGYGVLTILSPKEVIIDEPESGSQGV